MEQMDGQFHSELDMRYVFVPIALAIAATAICLQVCGLWRASYRLDEFGTWLEQFFED